MSLGALLPPDEAHDYRRHDLLVMEAHGQGIYDTADPRHPQRWFDRDDLREQCASSLAYVRMSQNEQAAHTKEAMARLVLTLDTDASNSFMSIRCAAGRPPWRAESPRRR